MEQGSTYLNECLREILRRIERALKLGNLRPRQGFGDGNILNNRRLIPASFQCEVGHGLGGIRGKFLDELDLEARGGGGSGGGGGDGDGAAEGAEEEGEVESEGDAVVVLAGYAVVVEERLLAELREALDAVAVEEVVEEHGVVAREEEVARFSRSLQGREEPPLQELHAVVGHEGLEFHRGGEG